MEKDFLIAQCLGCFALIASIISVTQKNRGKYIVFNIIQNIFSAVQYLFLSKYIAFYLCLISVVRLIIYSLRKYCKKFLNIAILLFFVTINIWVSLLNFHYWYDLMPLIASTLVCFTVWQKDITVIRIGCLVSKALWGVYAVICLAYFSVIMDIFIIIWTIFVLINAHKMKKISGN